MLSFHSFILVLSLLGALIAPASALAERTVDLFTVEALVVNQSEEARRKVASSALETIFVRLSGTKTVLEHPLVRRAVNNTSRYLYEFRYQSTEETITILGEEQPANSLLMRFSQTPLENILKQAQLPLWSENRPEVLLWTAVQSDFEKAYDTEQGLVEKSLRAAAEDRGLPILRPILDLQDRSALPAPLLWALDDSSILAAASRYPFDGVLAGRFRRDSSGWVLNALLLHNERTFYFNSRGERLDEVSRDVVNKVTDYFANIYAVVPGTNTSDNQMVIQVNNVTNFSDYRQLLDYLDSLSLVQSSSLSRVNYPHLQVKIELNDELDKLLSILALNQKLVQVEPAEPSWQPLEVIKIATLISTDSNSIDSPVVDSWMPPGTESAAEPVEPALPVLEFLWQ
ncbi:MAG: hypothetical protein ACI82Z_001769 [Cellvibrionaceae bacterium]|jgi:hypothetical protein